MNLYEGGNHEQSAKERPAIPEVPEVRESVIPGK